MSDPLYKVGDRVSVRIVRGPHVWKWTGTVTRANDTGDDDQSDWEYWVSGGPKDWPGGTVFPLLAWEHEVSPVKD